MDCRPPGDYAAREMQTAQDALRWASAGAFLILAARAVAGWMGRRERAEAHLAWAMGLFGAAMLSLVTVSLAYPSGATRLFPPEPLRLMTPILVLLSLYAFLLFLSDFVRFPLWAHLAAVGATLLMIILTVIERPDIAIVDLKIVRVPVHNPMDFIAFVKLLYWYLAAGFGILAVSFLFYGVRVEGLARLRMLLIAVGFALLFVSSGIVPRLLIGRPSSSTIAWVIVVNQALIILSAPLLFLGFTPPRAITRRLRPEADAVPGPA